MNIFQKDPNLIFFVIFSYKINILPSTWDHWLKIVINVHAIIKTMFNLFLLKLRLFDNGLNNR